MCIKRKFPTELNAERCGERGVRGVEAGRVINNKGVECVRANVELLCPSRTQTRAQSMILFY